MADYEEFYDDFERALAGFRPLNLTGVDLEHHTPGSANKHLLENAALAISTPSKASQVLGWLPWYSTRPLHENEATTCSESYRPGIDYPTLALAGFAFDHGQHALSETLLDRSRASICDLLLSVGVLPPRVVRDEGIPGQRGVLVGDGPFTPLPGSDVPAILGVGMRGHVRADTPQGNLGPWRYLYQRVQAVMVCQALGLAYRSAGFLRHHEVFENIVRRWPLMRRWGFSEADRLVARAYLENPADPIAARQIHDWAAMFPSNQGRLRVRGTDRAVESVALELGSSSTGGVAINCQRADGVTFRASSDTGTRFKGDIRPQTAEIVGGRIRCCWVGNPSSELSIARVVKEEAWVSIISPLGNTFSVRGSQPSPQPLQPIPTPPAGTGGLLLDDLGPAGPGERLYGSKNPKLTIREIHGDAASGYPKRWIAAEKP